MSFHTGATFIPGGDDAYYLPEVVAPAPQRIGENATNMQQNVASFEQQAHGQRAVQMNQPSYTNGTSQNGSWQNSSHQVPPQPQHPSLQKYGNEYESTPVSAMSQRNTFNAPTPSRSPNFYGVSEVPNFSPFPPLRNPGPNIPPTDEQKEAVLESAREAVLACNDPDQQLTWAQDALSYCEVAIQNEARVSRTQAARPKTPRVEHVLREDAMKVTNFLADQLHPKAQFMRGMWYEFGKFGCPVDKPESYQCYKRASERGYTRAWYRMGMQFEAGNDPLTAIKYYKQAADQGDSAACYRLGMMTLLGQHGQQQDFEQGMRLIYTAAQGADDNAPQGAYVLGMLQAQELPQVRVPESYLRPDTTEAKTNIERAAFLGFAKAQVRMGSAYELGELNCPFDPSLSLHYNALAARQGEVEAEMAISKWFLCGHEGLFEKNEELAFTYAQRAAIDGLPTAQFAVGYFYEVGIYVNMDLKEAKDWYRKADENGNKDAKKRIEAVSRSKTISRKDHENISLQRIRNQHAQQLALQPLPEVPSSSLEMPDPSRLTLNDAASHRPASAAPYPAGASLAPQPSVPDFRPTSAFGINPNLRPPSAASLPPQRQEYYGHNGGPPGRPFQQGYPEDQYGRRPSGGPPQQQRYPGRPPSASPHMNPNAGPGGNPSPRPLPAQFRPQGPPHANSAPNAIGFMAPIDAQGADRPNWTPKMSGAGEGPRPQNYGPPARSDGMPPRTSSGAPTQSGGRPHPASQQQNPQRMTQQQQTQTRPVPNQAPGKAQSARPTSAATQIQPKPPAPQQVSASQAASKPPPKQGPATFEAMGIQAGREEKDCIVM